MSSTNLATEASVPDRSIELKELAAVLVKHYGIHTGRYVVAVKFRIGAGAVAGPNGSEKTLPGVVVGIEGIALNEASSELQSEDIVDAAEVNPL